jgi:glutathione synthase/RimK-type ligase-like ATP-grasp enzyme
MGLQPAWVTPGGVFAVTINWREVYINFARSPLNSDNSVSLAKNKYIARMILDRNGIANIPFARPNSHEEAEAFLTQHGTVIAKPVDGSGAFDIHIVTQADQLRALRIENYILEKYIVGREMRYLVLNDAIVGMYQSEYGASVEATRPLQCIAYPETEHDETVVELSLRITKIMNLAFAAVDYLVDDAGQAHFLEINTMPDLKWFHAPTSGPVVDAAGRFMQAIVAADGETIHTQLSTVGVS